MRSRSRWNSRAVTRRRLRDSVGRATSTRRGVRRELDGRVHRVIRARAPRAPRAAARRPERRRHDGSAEPLEQDELEPPACRPSCRAACARAARAGVDAAAVVGSPAVASSRSIALARRRADASPAPTDVRAASTMPIATASPCSQRSYPAIDSIAWPNVWPRFSSARRAVLALVLGDDRGLDLAAAADRVRRARRRRARSSFAMCASSQAKNSASTITPYLMTSASPARSSRGGSVASVSVSASTRRLMERADHVLAARVVDRRLAADRRVDLREQRRRAPARSRRRAGSSRPRSP